MLEPRDREALLILLCCNLLNERFCLPEHFQGGSTIQIIASAAFLENKSYSHLLYNPLLDLVGTARIGNPDLFEGVQGTRCACPGDLG